MTGRGPATSPERLLSQGFRHGVVIARHHGLQRDALKENQKQGHHAEESRVWLSVLRFTGGIAAGPLWEEALLEGQGAGLFCFSHRCHPIRLLVLVPEGLAVPGSLVNEHERREFPEWRGPPRLLQPCAHNLETLAGGPPGGREGAGFRLPRWRR